MPPTTALHSLAFFSFSSVQVWPLRIVISSQPTCFPLHAGNSLGAGAGPDSGSERMPRTRVLDLSLYSLPAVWLWLGYLVSQYLSFPSCKMGMF